jgi:hypothetical protein
MRAFIIRHPWVPAVIFFGVIPAIIVIVLAMLTSCGGQSVGERSMADSFVEAACSHEACPGWGKHDACVYSFRIALEMQGAQDERCVDNATAILEQSPCGPETNTIADDVINGKCSINDH